MKNRKLLSITLSLITGFLNGLFAQNCNLINSATFTVPNNTVISSHGHVPYVLDTNLPYYMPLEIQQWQYITITKDNLNKAKIYKNGQLVFEGNYANVSYSWSRLDLGAVFYTSYNGWFNGWIDEIRVSNIVRSASDISNIYSSNSAFKSDANTIGLWHFDQSSGTTITSSSGPSGSITNATWDSQGRFNQCLFYNGSNARATLPLVIPTSNMTFEFWIKPNVIQNGVWPVSWYGYNTAGFTISKDTKTAAYKWSTGETGNSITVDPSKYPYISVTDGNCTDTIYFDSQSATDTIVINTGLLSNNPITYNNSITIYPNPAKGHITIDCGKIDNVVGYHIEITNSLGQLVFNQPMNTQQYNVALNSWTGTGIYFVKVYDASNKVLTTKKIILQ